MYIGLAAAAAAAGSEAEEDGCWEPAGVERREEWAAVGDGRSGSGLAVTEGVARGLGVIHARCSKGKRPQAGSTSSLQQIWRFGLAMLGQITCTPP